MTIDRAKTIEMAREADCVLEGDISGAGRLPMLLERFKDLVLEEAAALVQANADACGVWTRTHACLSSNAAAIRAMKSDSGHSVSSVAEASTWQPFDTAPQDGIVFLAVNHDREVWVAAYITKNGPPRLAYRTNGLRESKRYRVHEIDGKRLMEELESSESWDSNWTYWSRGYTFAPTHWMPLPAAPRGA